jgi:5-methyltetrahydrofolate--homocysteine methyltransferase
MTTTTISSATREVHIGFDQPFVIIGERINPTGRKILAEEMKNGDYSRVESDALAQVAAGAHMLDVNAGIPLADEPRILAEAVQLVQSITDVPLSIDSSIVEALEAGLAVYQGKALVNSVTGEDEVLERVLPLVAKYKAAVVAISNDETGISEDPNVRFAVAKKIVERAADYGIPYSDIVVDPLVMPIGAINTAGVQVMALVRRLREELKVNTTCGASNVSFGLPNRNGINAAFLTMAMGAGMTSAITSPLHPEVMQAVRGGDVMMGHDPDCTNWIRAYREPAAEGEGRGGRRAGRPVDAGAPDPWQRATSKSCSCPQAAAGSFRAAPHFWTLPAVSVSILIRSAAGAASAVDVRSAASPAPFAKHQIESNVDHLSPFSATEEKFEERKGPLKESRRLSCHTTLLDDAVIDVPAESQVHRQIVRKEMESRDIRLDTATRLYYVQIEAPASKTPRRNAVFVRGPRA